MGVRSRLALRPLVSLLAGSLALAALPPNAAADPPAHRSPPAAHRRSTGMVIAGITLTAVGAVAVGVGGGFAGSGEGEGVGLGLAIAVPGAAALLSGVPLWIIGASTPGPERPQMKLAGIILTAIGGAATVAGLACIGRGTFSGGAGALAASIGLLPTGLLATEIGVPLWVIGAGTEPSGRSAASIRLLPNGIGFAF